MEGSLVRTTKAKLFTVLAIGLLSLFLLLILSWSLGAVDLSFSSVLQYLANIIAHGGPDLNNAGEQIVWSRMVRSVAVIGVGIGLSISGVVMQALIRNPLVDPYVTGVSSGAALGATLSILAGISILQIAEFTTPFAAFVGAIVTFLVTMALAEAAGGRSVNYVLSGIIVGIALSSITTILIVYSNDARLHGALFCLFGSFANISPIRALLIILPIIILSVLILLYARELNVILLGDEHARQLGLNVKMFKRITVLLVSVLTAVSVAFTGIIAFLGLIVPHTSRMLVGGDHRLLIPTSMVMGADVLLAADIFSRTAMRPSELPIGAIISLIGAPFFIYLMIRKGREYAG